ncbi:MAG: VWA domain-containing protein [Gemmataceae bacterium]|nr:VWA domain-containing protein [Gemmataceae bacterium]
MAFRPASPAFRWGTWVLFVGLFGFVIGCNRRDDAPAVAETKVEVKNQDGGFEPQLDAATRSEREKAVGLSPHPGETAALTAVAGLSGRSGATRDSLLRASGGSSPSRGKARSLNQLAADLKAPMGLAIAGVQREVLPGDEAGEMTAEQYQHFLDNPFKLVKGEDALSTISTAVDTAAYSNVRARINEGILPTKDAVRIADFVNYFPYDYATPKNGEPVAFKLEMAPCPWNAKHHLLRVGLKAKVIDKDQLPARNLVFLVDTSGSMNAPNRLPLVQESLRLLVEQLTDRDRVSIVSYAGDAGLRLPPTPGNKKDVILDVILGLSSGGSTNGEGGIKVAYEQAEKTFLKEGINRVILATDGDFNVGISDRAQLTRMIEDKRKTGVYLTVLGYGMNNLHDAMLEQLAHHGNGHYAYIDSLDEAKKLFVEQGGALVTVAKDVKLQIEFNPAKVAGYRLIGYENRILRNEDFRDDAKDAGDLGSGHTSTALYEIVPVGEKVVVGEVEKLKYQTKTELTEAAKSGEWMTVRMRYKHPETDKASEVSSILAADGLAKEASADLRFAGAAAAFGLILRDSEYRGDATLDKVIDLAKPAIGADKGGHRAEFVRIVEKAKSIPVKKEQK